MWVQGVHAGREAHQGPAAVKGRGGHFVRHAPTQYTHETGTSGWPSTHCVPGRAPCMAGAGRHLLRARPAGTHQNSSVIISYFYFCGGKSECSKSVTKTIAGVLLELDFIGIFRYQRLRDFIVLIRPDDLYEFNLTR